MKAVMYHYVRPVPPDMPHFRYLHVDGFRRQLDWLKETVGFVSRDAFVEALEGGPVPDAAVLTFDDAFSDHYDHVFHELSARGLWGVFYAPSAILRSDRLLDVHRIHVLLGRVGGTRALDAAMRLVDDTMLSHGTIDAFRRQTYTRQDNDADTTTFKRVMNYFISYEHRAAVLDRLMGAFGIDPAMEAAIKQDFYVDAAQLRRMAEGGMTIGSHGANHLLMSKLSEPSSGRRSMPRSGRSRRYWMRRSRRSAIPMAASTHSTRRPSACSAKRARAIPSTSSRATSPRQTSPAGRRRCRAGTATPFRTAGRITVRPRRRHEPARRAFQLPRTLLTARP